MTGYYLLTYRYDNCTTTTIEKYMWENITRYGFYSSCSKNGRSSAEKDRATLEHWHPKPGEYCWFLTCNCGYELGQFVETLSNGNFRYRLNRTNSLFNCSHCEPYIGNLPSFIKDTK